VRADGWTSQKAVLRETNLANGAVTLDQPAPNASGTTPTARAGVRYSLTRDLWLRAAAYDGFRTPTLNELYRPFRVGNNVTEANAGLRPERLQGVEVGAGGAAPFDWTTTLFFNRLVDAVTNVTIGVGPNTFPTAGFIPAGGILTQRQNVGAINAVGLEGDASGQAAPGLGWRAAFAYTHARVDGGAQAPQLTGKRPAESPELTVTSGLDWRPRTRLSLSADLRFETARYDDDLNKLRLAPGATLNLRAGWRVASRSEVYLAVENLGGASLQVQRTANDIVSYDEPATVRVGFAYRR
jgi:outer membrane receptor protein involved in Fe transport